MDINHLTLEELKIVKDAIIQRINELSPYPSQQKALEDSKLALRRFILENKEKVTKDLEEMRDKSIKNEQETLEEVAERMYSDDEVIQLLQTFNDVCNLTNEPHQIKNFFNQFKKL
jgi:archaellum biogenesis ATPase FlaH